MPHLPDFEAWAVFAKVAETGSFSQAAKALGLANTTVSKIITRLEERHQTTLFHRTTRQLALTESGRLCLARATRILENGSAVEEEILEQAAVPRGLIRMACTTAFGTSALAPVLPEFLKLYPEIDIDLQLIDGKIDMISDGFDLSIRVGHVSEPSLRISKLFSFRLPVVGSPAFFENHGRPAHPDELGRFPALIYSHVAGTEDWQFHHATLGQCTVHIDPRIRVNNALAAIPMLLGGVALALQPEVFIWRELCDGRLIEVLTDWHAGPVPVNLLSPPGRGRPARVRVLVDFLRAHFAGQPWARGIET